MRDKRYHFAPWVGVYLTSMIIYTCLIIAIFIMAFITMKKNGVSPSPLDDVDDKFLIVGFVSAIIFGYVSPAVITYTGSKNNGYLHHLYEEHKTDLPFFIGCLLGVTLASSAYASNSTYSTDITSFLAIALSILSISLAGIIASLYAHDGEILDGYILMISMISQAFLGFMMIISLISRIGILIS